VIDSEASLVVALASQSQELPIEQVVADLNKDRERKRYGNTSLR
jgi:hypothetical protein